MIDQLISVTFEDATDHDTLQKGQDIVGIPFDYYWGPANEVKTVDRGKFLRLYPECLPLGVSYSSPRAFMFSYAAAKRCLDMGADTLECIRILPEKYAKYWALIPTKVTSTDKTANGLPMANKEAFGWFFKESSAEQQNQLDTAGFSITLKYPGLIPSSFGYDKFRLHVIISGEKVITNDVAPIQIEILGVNVQKVNKTTTVKITKEDNDNDESKYQQALAQANKDYPEGRTTLADGTVQNVVKSSDESSTTFTVTISGESVIETATVEYWEGSFDKLARVDGKTFYIGDLVEGSNWISIYNTIDGNLDGGVSQTLNFAKNEYYADYSIPSESSGLSAGPHWSDAYSVAAKGKPALAPGNTTAPEYIQCFIDAYEQSFTDMEASQATILCPALAVKEIYDEVQNISSTKKYLTSPVGVPQNCDTSYTLKDTEIIKNKNIKEALKEYKKDLLQDKFTTLIVGCEKVTVFGAYPIVMDCTAGFVGRTVAIGNSVKLNQPASGKQYGSYQNGSVKASLREALSFDSVLELHEASIGSVYNSALGPRIWDIKTLHPRTSSYFSKWNVMRVCAAITRNIMELAANAIHTPTVTDDSLRNSFEINCNSVLGIYSSAGNIKPSSWADVSAGLNNDNDTNAGEKLIIELHIWFMKVVEQVSIKIIATDSRVTAELS